MMACAETRFATHSPRNARAEEDQWVSTFEPPAPPPTRIRFQPARTRRAAVDRLAALVAGVMIVAVIGGVAGLHLGRTLMPGASQQPTTTSAPEAA